MAIYLSCSSVNPVTGFRYKLSSSFDPCFLLPLQVQTPCCTSAYVRAEVEL